MSSDFSFKLYGAEQFSLRRVVGAYKPLPPMIAVIIIIIIIIITRILLSVVAAYSKLREH